MRLAELIGHGQAVALLLRLLRCRRLPHALLIEGRPGIGRRSLALALAQAHLCAQPVDGDACGRCEDCRLMVAGVHPDCSLLPDARARAWLDVDLIRSQVVEPAGESPLRGRGRVFVLPAIERLRREGANALLKVLEEPPPGTIIVMTTAAGEALLGTIRSRSRLIRLGILGADQIRQLLERAGLDAATARRRAASAQGSHQGLWQDEAQSVPIDRLRALLEGGLDLERVAWLWDRLPQDAAEVEGEHSLGAEQRRVLLHWLEVLLGELRQDLRGPGATALLPRIERLLRLRADLQRHLPPRLVLEAVGLEGA